jgi:hypothetical protein
VRYYFDYDNFIAGVDDEGIPIIKESQQQYHSIDGCHAEFEIGEEEDEYVHSTSMDLGGEYDFWFWAYRDLNDNLRLDPMEPFGVSLENPIKVKHCKHYTVEIEINELYEP